MKKIIYGSFIGIFICLLTACDTDNKGTVYSPVTEEVGFLTKNVKRELTADQNSFEILVTRSGKKGELTMPFTVTDPSGLLVISETVTFKDGEASAKIQISNIQKLQIGPEYTVTLALEAENITVGGFKETNIVLNRTYTFESIGIGKFTSEFFGESWNQEVQKAKEANVYKLPDCYVEGYSIIFNLDDAGNVVEFKTQQTGYEHAGYGMVSATLASWKREGKMITFGLEFTVSIGTFGVMNEILEMPN